uniref:C3H1-type domain-containing protein n=1 Tax=Brassica oleracea TaxID=3712 RepID=A0A3P6FZR4_BRAOL|nr:unnamed protein product [Brassica oleracea]
MDRYGRAGEEGSRSDPLIQWTSHGVESNPSMGRLALSGGGGGGGGESYPERSDEPDCIYYLRTGVCGYGSRCRFNHPRDRGAVIGGDGGLPERMGHPVCQHFMRTGTCQFGASCKYHHPRQGGGSVAPVSLSYMGYPLRSGEKECSYYMRTGQCKFGLTCRFNHPVPLQLQPQQQQRQPQPQLQSIYPTLQSQPMPSSQQYGLVLSRPSLLPGSYLPSHYGPPMVMQPGMATYPSWNPYQASLTAMPSPGTQPSIGSSSVYGIAPLSTSGPAYTGTYLSGGPPLTTSTEQSFPQRPDQPECQYFMRTGDCKFGSSCRYHHPPLDAVLQPKTGVLLSSIGLPLRPGVAQCTHFAQHGICKFGPACKFDHSTSSSLSYSPSASSLTNMPVAPYPIGSSAPISSSNEPTTAAVTAVVSSPMVSGLSQQEPAETSCDSVIEAKTSSS